LSPGVISSVEAISGPTPFDGHELGGDGGGDASQPLADHGQLLGQVQGPLGELAWARRVMACTLSSSGLIRKPAQVAIRSVRASGRSRARRSSGAVTSS